jgi:hypothetical protein
VIASVAGRPGHWSDELGQPVQADRRDDGAGHVAGAIIEWQRKWDQPDAGQYADRITADREFAGPGGVGEVGAAGDIRALAAGGAEGPAIHVNDDEGEKLGITLLDRRKISATGLGVACLDRRQLRERNQDLANALDDLLLFRGGELGKTKRLFLHLHLARAAEVELVVRLDRNRREKRNRRQQEQARQ